MFKIPDNVPNQVKARIRSWLDSKVVDQASKDEVIGSLHSSNTDDILSRFSEDLKFGTGGIRGIVGAGSSRMNLYTVRKTAWAIAQFFKEKHPSEELRLAVAYDTRASSRPFAEACAEVFAAYGIRTFFSDEPRPTPLLSFMIKHHSCHGGICMTASHNPSYYNGLKLYTSFGGQILPPEDGRVVEIAKTLTSFEGIKRSAFSKITPQLIKVISTEIDEAYLKRISSYISKEKNKNLSIVYTPLHGAGSKSVPLALKHFGFESVHSVKEQSNMDGDFSTLKYANPEDPDSFQLALRLAKKENISADLVLANDPDADRIGMYIKEGKDYWFLNGHEMLCLLTYYILSTRENESRDLVVKTVVTTDLMDKIAESFGVKIDETLTGFKWICGLIEQYERFGREPKLNYVCGGEESYGFLAGKEVADKDGVLACCIAAEMLCYFRGTGRTARQVLDELHLEHGFYLEELVSQNLEGLDGLEQIQLKIAALRENPPRQISEMNVFSLKDYQSSKQSFFGSDSIPATEIKIPPSNVLQFILEDGSKVSVRPSGTEPKVKFYFSVFQPLEERSAGSLSNAKALAKTKLDSLKQGFLAIF